MVKVTCGPGTVLVAMAFFLGTFPETSFSAGEARVGLSAFKQEQLGGANPELARILPVFISANLAMAGVPVVGVQGSEFAHLERLIFDMGLSYDEKNKVRPILPVSRMIEGTYRSNPDRTNNLNWQLLDIAREGDLKILHRSQALKIDADSFPKMTREIILKGNFLLSSPPPLPNRPAVVVGGFLVDEHVAEEVGWMMDDAVSVALQDLPDVRVVERTRIREIEKEIGLNLSGLGDAERGILLGRLTGADLLIFGAVMEESGEFAYAILGIDVWTGEIIRAITGKTEKAPQLASAAGRAAIELISEKKGATTKLPADLAPAANEASYRLYRAVRLYERSQLYPDASEFTAALEEVDRAVLLKPDDPAIRYMRGKILSKLGKAEEAVEEFVAIVKKYPKSEWAGECHHELGNLHFYWGWKRKDPPRTGMSMVGHYMTSALDFPNSYGAWESVVKLAMIFSDAKQETDMIAIYEKLIKAHPKDRNIVLYQWADAYLSAPGSNPYRNYAANWDKVQPIIRRMDFTGWWHMFRVLWVDFEDEDVAVLPKRVREEHDRLAVEAFDAAKEFEGKLLLTTCLEDHQTIHGKSVLEVRKDLAEKLLEYARHLVELTLPAADMTNQEKAAFLYNATRKMVLISFSYAERFEVAEAVRLICTTIFTQFPDESPYPLYALNDLVHVSFGAYDNGLDADLHRPAEEYVLARTRLPDRTDILARLIKLDLMHGEWNRAAKLIAAYEQSKDRNEKELKSFQNNLSEKRKSYVGSSWAPSERFQGRDFQIRFARPALNFQMK